MTAGAPSPQPDDGRAAGPDVGFAVAAALAALAWGLLLAPRGYADGDASELTLALALGGVPHPTGYPLYTLAGHAATSGLHSLGVAWPVAANAWSALGSSVAIYFLARVAGALAASESRASLPGGALTSALALIAPLLLLVVQPLWTLAAASAEVYSWHVAWVAATAWLAWRLASRGDAKALPRRAWLAWGIAVGLGLAHHATSLIVSLPLTVWLLRRKSRIGPGGLVSLAGGSVLPLLSWAWIAYRANHPAEFQWPLLEPGLTGLLNHVSGKAYGGYLGGFHPSQTDARLLASAIPWLVLTLLTTVSAALNGADGLRRSYVRALVVAMAGQALFVLAYRVPDPSAHLLPLLALATTTTTLVTLGFARRTGGPVAILAAAALVIALVPAAIARDVAARGEAEDTDMAVRAAWERIPFERGFVAWNNDLYARLRAFQILEGSHPLRIVAHPGVLSWEGPRRSFEHRYGFDPWDGAAPKTEEALAGLAASAARAGRLPAVDFDDAIRAERAGGRVPTW